MKEDFHNYTELEQFNLDKINKFARLEAIKGFKLLRSEREYLECYRAILKNDPQYVENTTAPGLEQESAEENTPEPEKPKKTAKKAPKSEPATEE